MLEINLDTIQKENEQRIWTLLRLYAEGILRYDEVERGIALLKKTVRWNAED